MLEMEKPEGFTHLDEGHGAIRVTEGLYHCLRRHQVRYTMCGRSLLLCLLILKRVEQVFTPMLLVAVLHDSPQRLGPRHLPAE